MPFFSLLCLNNYSKVFQKRRIFKLLLGGTRLGYPLGGAPLRPLAPPQGSPGVTEFWKKLHKFSKLIYKFYMHQNTPNYDPNIHFGPNWLLGGAVGGQNLDLAPGGGFSHRIKKFKKQNMFL